MKRHGMRFLLIAYLVYNSLAADGKVIYVDLNAAGDRSGSNWQNACADVSAGLVASVSGDEIWVAAGRYHEAIEIKVGVALYGGFTGGEVNREERNWVANPTIIDATGLNKTTVYCTKYMLLDGFTITGGSSQYGGGGVECYNGSPLLVHCTITRNLSKSEGGGLLFDRSSAQVVDCTIAENGATYGGGVSCRFESLPTLFHCVISGNTAEQWGGGIVIYTGTSLKLMNCAITKNTAADCGGIMINGGTATLSNCIIAGNSAHNSGGGLTLWSSSPALNHCTITGNKAATGGGVSGRSASPLLTHCIVWGDSPDEINLVKSNLDNSITWSFIQGGFDGEGNIDGDPMFVQPWEGTSADLHLLPGSPCIDAGNPDSAFNDGFLPPGMGTIRCDMGAYGGPLNGGWQVKEEPVTVPNWPVY